MNINFRSMEEQGLTLANIQRSREVNNFSNLWEENRSPLFHLPETPNISAEDILSQLNPSAEFLIDNWEEMK